MATPWQLVITQLDGVQAPRDVTVEADNWLAALRAARSRLGEEGGVPAGANCVMSSAGDVTIVDPATQLRYELRKCSVDANPRHSRPGPAPAGGQKVRNATVAYSPEEAAQIRKALVSAQAAQPAPKVAPVAPKPAQVPSAPKPQAAPPAGPASPAAPPASPAAPPAPRKPRPQTVAYMHNPLGAPPPSAPEVSQAPKQPAPPRAPLPPTATPAGKSQAGTTGDEANPDSPELLKHRPTDGGSAGEAAAKAPEAPQGKKKRPMTVAYMHNPFVAQPPATAAPTPQAPPAAPPAPAPLPAAPPPPETPAAALAPPAPPQPAAAPSAAPKPAPAPSPVAAAGAGPQLLHSRDEEPTESRPLIYRERAFAVDPQTDELGCEWLLREQLAVLINSLDPEETGKFVSIALFDHAWTGRPSRPPLATLQWKDWRGEPVLRFAGAASSAQWRAPSGAPPATSLLPEAPRPVLPTSAAPPAAAVPPPAAAALPPTQQPAPAQAEPAAAPPPQAPPPQAPPPQAPAPAPANAMQSWPRTTTPGASSRPPAQTGDQDRRLAYAFEATQDLYFLDTPGDGVAFAVRLLQELIPCEGALGTLYDINTDELRVLSATGPGAADQQARALPAKKGLFAIAVASGLTVWVSLDLAADPRFKPELDGRAELTPRNAAYIVLRQNDTLLGVLQLCNRTDERGFTEADKAVASYIADQLTSYLRERRIASRKSR